MIGDRPKGAPLRCKLGRHTGQGEGGLMVYTCPRCGGDFWQDNDRMRATIEVADRMIDEGRADEALALARQVVRDEAGKR